MNELQIVDKLDVEVKTGSLEITDYDVIKDTIQAIADGYKKPIVYNEESYKQARSDISRFNKLKDGIERIRKDNKQLYLEPLKVFEKSIKSLVAIVDETSYAIKSQTEELKQKWIEDSQAKAMADETIEVEFNPKDYSRVSTKDSIEKVTLTKIHDTKKAIAQLESDKATISAFAKTIELDPEPYFLMLKDGFTVNEVIQRLQQTADNIQKRIADQKELDQKREEYERTIAQTVEQEIEPFDEETTTEYFKINATTSQLMKIHDFLINEGIDYECLNTQDV